jgi:WD40 repeat protein
MSAAVGIVMDPVSNT